MGRVKLQIKRIENNTNRQVTYSKRRNGLMKKAFEISVLCEVDVGLLMFSPSGRVSVFAGNNKSIEQIMTRFVNLPEHEKGVIQSQEHLNKLIAKLKEEVADQNRQESSVSTDSQLEDLQEELKASKSQVVDMEKRLRIYEGDLSEITTLDEVHYREHLLEEALKQVRMRKEMLEEHYECHISQPSTQVQLHGAEHMHLHGLAPREANNVFQWFPAPRDPQLQVLNFLDSNGLLPQQREPTHHRQGADRMMMPPLNLLSGNMNVEEHMSRSHRSSGLRDQDGVKIESTNNVATINRVPQDPSSSGYGHGFDVNLNSPWVNHQFYQAGNDHALPSEQPRERAILELFLSQLHPEA
ncbi:agamous-like MADS-box protein AGL104 isoform X2 [Daucus carota subsp. sativus]|uniref:agamous-like MADS-box protein AGL104 isoform X2 n=1 Tax=Daucus carota subsp. sativus TaxID=79200 RepID=UPI0007EF9425|nr:PREDICTED: agamous-like MADS-box protein AGL104 isoform X2 [Daucus carota subsp. sativus]